MSYFARAGPSAAVLDGNNFASYFVHLRERLETRSVVRSDEHGRRALDQGRRRPFAFPEGRGYDGFDLKWLRQKSVDLGRPDRVQDTDIVLEEVAGNHDDPHRRPQPSQFRNKPQAVHVGKARVDKCDGEGALCDNSNRASSQTHGGHCAAETGKRTLQDPAHVLIVIDDKDCFRRPRPAQSTATWKASSKGREVAQISCDRNSHDESRAVARRANIHASAVLAHDGMRDGQT